jgi:thiol-disulfide isomerase/thioredoxin
MRLRFRLALPLFLVGAVASACSSGSSSGGSATYNSGGAARPAPQYASAPAQGYAPSRSGNTAYVFTASWCHYCQKLKANTLPNPQVQAELASLNWQQIDPDVGSGRQLAQRYGVRGYPTTVVVNPSGGVVKVIDGYREPGDYLSQLRQAH